MDWLPTKLLTAIFLPPLNFLLLGILGLTIIGKRPAIGKALLWLMILMIWLFSLPVVANNLLRVLEKGSQLENSKLHLAQAIVVLGGAGGSLQHARYAAVLYRKTSLPILVTGGDPRNVGVVDADRMTKMLENEFHVPVTWKEKEAQNTIQNAALSARILKRDGVNSILLVTHGWHMARAKQLFENEGMNVIPAATELHYNLGQTLLDFLPSPEGLGGSRIFFHEILGIMQLRIFS